MNKSRSRQRLMIGLSLAWSICLLVQVSVLRDYGISFRAAFTDASVSCGLLCAYSFLTILVFRVVNVGLKNGYQRLTWVLALTTLIVIKEKWLIHFILNDAQYDVFFLQHLYLRICITLLFCLLITLLTWMWYYFKAEQETNLQQEKIQQTLKESELNKLRQQLQPHFLFNSLNSISALVVSEPKLARNMIQNLSDFLRGTIKKEDNQLTTLGEELSLLNLYLSIEKIRFGHRLKTDLIIPNELAQTKLPPLLLQPLLENSIKFGLYDRIDEVLITLNATVVQNELVLEIKNPYDSKTATQRQGEGFGLSAVARRLVLIYGRTDLLNIESNADTFTCTIRIPQQYSLAINPHST